MVRLLWCYIIMSTSDRRHLENTHLLSCRCAVYTHRVEGAVDVLYYILTDK